MQSLKTICAHVVAENIHLINCALPEDLYNLIQECIYSYKYYKPAIIYITDIFSHENMNAKVTHNNLYSYETTEMFVDIFDNQHRACETPEKCYNLNYYFGRKSDCDPRIIIGIHKMTGYTLSRIKKSLLVYVDIDINCGCGGVPIYDINFNPLSREKLIEIFCDGTSNSSDIVTKKTYFISL
jgi:hypothetical protein